MKIIKEDSVKGIKDFVDWSDCFVVHTLIASTICYVVIILEAIKVIRPLEDNIEVMVKWESIRMDSLKN